MERIIQRLGISVNKVTLLHNESDDTLLIMREMICKLLVEKAYAKAEYILSEYEMVADLSSPLHMQYVLETRGGLYSQRAMESTKKSWNFITRHLRQCLIDLRWIS